MHYEIDYTDDLAELEDVDQEPWVRWEESSRAISERKLEHFMEFCSKLQGQMDDSRNKGRREKLLAFYKGMKQVAYIHSGRLALDIDEENFKGRLVYWGRCLAFMGEESQDTKEMVVQLISEYPSVFIEPRHGGIRLTVETDLFEQPLSENDLKILDRIRKELREIK